MFRCLILNVRTAKLGLSPRLRPETDHAKVPEIVAGNRNVRICDDVLAIRRLRAQLPFWMTPCDAHYYRRT